MARTIAQIEQEQSRLQTILNSMPANKKAARNEMMGNIRKLQAEHDSVKSSGAKKKKGSPMILYMVIGAVAVIAISFAAAFFTGSKM